MHPINHAEANKNMREVFEQKTQCIPSSRPDVRQIRTCAEHRHKRKQRQQGYERPDDFVSF